MHINVNVKAKKLRNKKKEQDKKKFLIFMIENGEIKKNQMLQKISNLLLDLKVRLMEHQY